MSARAWTRTSCCRPFRRVSYRSALTASLATRLVPVLARDAARMGDAARCRPQPPGPAGGGARGAGRRARPRRGRGGRARGARLRAGAAGPRARRRPWSRHDLRVGAPPLRDRRPCAIGGARRGRRGGWRRIPTLDMPLGPARAGAGGGLRAAGRRALRRPRRAAGGGACLSRWCRAERSATVSRAAARPRPARRVARARAGHVHRAGRPVGLGQVDAAARAVRAGAALPRRRGRRRARGGRARRARARPGRAGGGVRHRLPGPRDAGGDGRRAGRARAAARAPRRAAGRGGARRGGDGAGARRGAPARAAHRHALRAASCSAWRSPPRWCTARSCCCSTSRPRSSTRWPATSWSGCCAG